MIQGKYIDWEAGRPLGEADGCEWGKWVEARENAVFGRKGDNLFVFLPASVLESNDKYALGVFDAAADESTPFFQMRLGVALDLLERYGKAFGTPSRLLDVGCGRGALLEALQTRMPQLELTGIDLSLAALEEASCRVPSAEFVLADAHNPPFFAGYFDAAHMGNILEHVGDPLSLLTGIVQVLRPGGGLILSTPSRYRLENLIRIVMGKRIQFMSQDHVTEYSVGQVEELLRRAGLRTLEVRGPWRRPARWTLRNTLARSLLKPMLHAFLFAIGSRHVLEPTAFFLAQRGPER